MNHFISHKRRPTAAGNLTIGTLKSPLLQDCTFIHPYPNNNTNFNVRYIMSVLFKRVFMFKCSLPMLRLTTALALLALPIVFTRLTCFYRRIRPPASILTPSSDAIVLSFFPIAWFFGFLYYTEVPSLVFVIATIVAAGDDRHWLAALVCCQMSSRPRTL